jgi:hypothetical protein
VAFGHDEAHDIVMALGLFGLGGSYFYNIRARQGQVSWQRMVADMQIHGDFEPEAIEFRTNYVITDIS